LKATSHSDSSQNSAPTNVIGYGKSAASPVSSHSHSKALISPRFSAEAFPGPANLHPSQLPFIEEVKSKLRQGGYTVESSPCPCGQTNGVVVSEVDRYGLPLTFVVCQDCGTLRIDPYLDRESLEDFYTHSYQRMYARSTDVDAYFQRQKSYGEKVLDVARESIKPGSWVYEVGCGAGGALAVFQSNGYQVAGCDYSAELIAAGKQRGVLHLYHGAIADIQTGAKADLIYLHHVFEHMNHPLAFLEECRNLLAPGGRIIIIVPDVSAIDRFTCPAGDLVQFLHIAHKYNFSFEGLRRLGRKARYRANRLTPNPDIQTSSSLMPELWIEFTVDEDAAEERENDVDKSGSQMLEYLKHTEKLYSLGLCRGQLLLRLNSVKNFTQNNLGRITRITPAKVIRKLKGAT
jgi:SAM-dependent methyltransferase